MPIIAAIMDDLEVVPDRGTTRVRFEKRRRPGLGANGRPAARARTRRACRRPARRPSSRPSTRSARGPSRPPRRAARRAGCARSRRPGSLTCTRTRPASSEDSSSSMTWSSPAPPWRTALFTSSQVSSRSVLSSSAGSHDAALSIQDRARSGARLPPAIAMRSRLRGVRVSVGDLARWNEPSGGWRPGKRAGPGLGPHSASAFRSACFSGASPEAGRLFEPPTEPNTIVLIGEMKVEDPEQALTEAVCSRVREHLSGADAELAEAFARQYYRWVAPEDVAERDPLDLYGLALGALQLRARAPAGHAEGARLQPALRGARLAVHPHGRRDRDRRHAVPHRLGQHGAEPARLRRPPDHPPGARPCAATATGSSSRSSRPARRRRRAPSASP